MDKKVCLLWSIRLLLSLSCYTYTYAAIDNSIGVEEDVVDRQQSGIEFDQQQGVFSEEYDIESDLLNEQDNILFSTTESLLEPDRLLDEGEAYDARQYRIYLSGLFIGNLLIDGGASLHASLSNISEGNTEEDYSVDTSDSFGAYSMSAGVAHHLRKYPSFFTYHRTYYNYLSSITEEGNIMSIQHNSIVHDYIVGFETNSLVLGVSLGQLAISWDEDIGSIYTMEGQESSSIAVGFKLGGKYEFVSGNKATTSLEYGFQYMMVNNVIRLHRAASIEFNKTEQTTDISVAAIPYIYLGFSTAF